MPTATLPTAPPPTVAAGDSQKRVADAVRKVTAIATLPEVTAKIITTVEDPRSSASQLHKIVSHDPALVTRILKVVNSAFYGLPGQIGSIERAIVLLGLNAVKNIAVAASLGQLFRGGQAVRGVHRQGPVDALHRRRRRRPRAGPADEAADGRRGVPGRHDPRRGHPDLAATVARADCARSASAPRRATANFCELEREVIGMDHQQLGMGLAEQWKFPRPCQLVAGYHHNPDRPGRPEPAAGHAGLRGRHDLLPVRATAST